MTDFIVHTVPGSPFARAVLVTLEEKHARYRLEPLAPGAMRSDQYRGMHPFGRIPVLDHGDFRLYETQAILRYLDRVLLEPPLSPASNRDLARMDQVMNICDWYLFQGVGNVIGFQRFVAPRILGLPTDEAACAAAMPAAHRVFGVLSGLLGAASFLGGTAPSLADILAGTHLSILSGVPEWRELTADRPNLVDWLARMEARPSFVATTIERLTAQATAAA